MNNRSDNDWAAFQYLAEELSPAEQVEFEQELETSESACDELVKSVRFTQSLAVAMRQDDAAAPNRTNGRKQIPRQTSFLRNCACLILVVAVTFGLGYSFGLWDQDRATENQIVDISSKDIVHPDLARANELIAIWADIESDYSDGTAMDDVFFEDLDLEGDLDNEEEIEDDSFDWLHSAFTNSITSEGK